MCDAHGLLENESLVRFVLQESLNSIDGRPVA